jgi:putative ABC transport system permease protein
MQHLITDIRFGLGAIGRNPGMALVAVLTLAIGIGANTAIFSYVDGVLLHSLPYAMGDGIVMLTEGPGSGKGASVPFATYEHWKSRSRSFGAITAVASGAVQYGTQQVRAAEVTSEYFEVFGITPVLGRTLTQGDKAACLLSESFWEDRFGRSSAVIGRTITLNGEPQSIVGILPDANPFDRTFADVWKPMLKQDQPVRVYARMKPGVPVEQAKAELRDVTVDPFTQRVVHPKLRSALQILLTVAGAMLLIGCANLANRIVVRYAGTVRPARITAHLVLAVLGGAAGAGICVLLNRWMLAILSGGVDLSMDPGVLLFATAFVFSAALMFGAPGNTMQSQQVVSSLVVGQVALSFVLLTGSGLLVRGLSKLQDVDSAYSVKPAQKTQEFRRVQDRPKPHGHKLRRT